MGAYGEGRYNSTHSYRRHWVEMSGRSAARHGRFISGEILGWLWRFVDARQKHLAFASNRTTNPQPSSVESSGQAADCIQLWSSATSSRRRHLWATCSGGSDTCAWIYCDVSLSDREMSYDELAEYNQQDATFHNLFISVRRSACFRRLSRLSSGAQNCTYSVRYLSDQYCYLLLAWLVWVGWNSFELLMRDGKTVWNV